MILITLEGIDGSGKTTISKLLKEKLCLKGKLVLLTREPGGNKISEQIRNIILNKDNLEMDSWTEALLYIAARKQHINECILPALKKGKIVICDRFIDSIYAYQGYARGLGIKNLNKIQSIIFGKLKPDLTLFFDIELKIAKKRVKFRNNDEINRFDLEKKFFYEKVYKGYKILINKNKKRIKIIDASKSLNEVLEESYFYVNKIIKKNRG